MLNLRHAVYRAEPDSFAQMLAEYRQRRGLSRNQLALQVGVNPSYLTRIENGQRGTPKADIVEGLARALCLVPSERGPFFWSAGYVPPDGHVLVQDPVVSAVADVMADARIDEQDREAFRSAVMAMVRQWRRGR